MTTKATLNLDGFAEYLEKLAKAAVDIDQAAEEGLEVGADVLVNGMQRRAPFNHLREEIKKTQTYHDGDKTYLYLGILRDSPAEIARVANVWEFGGRDSPSPRNPKRKPRPGIVARPFIRPTLRNDAKKARAAIEVIFQKWLKK